VNGTSRARPSRRTAGSASLAINLELTGGGFDETRAGRAGELVPVWVDEMLGKSGDR
jgi:hypothetical protein